MYVHIFFRYMTQKNFTHAKKFWFMRFTTHRLISLQTHVTRFQLYQNVFYQIQNTLSHLKRRNEALNQANEALECSFS